MATLKYDVDVDTKRAEARIGAFALRMRKQISDAIKSLPEIELDANSTKAEVEIARIRRELKDLAGKKIGVDIDAKAAEAQLQKLGAELRALSGKSGSVQVDADVASALAALGLVDKAVDKIDGRKATVKVDVDRSLGDSIIQVTRLAGALKVLALPAAAASIAPQLAAIGGALLDASGAAGLIPAVALAAGGAIGTLAVGFAHLGDALGPAGTPAQLKKVTEALAALAPNARATVEEVRGLARAWTDLRLDVQQRLFAGMAAEVKSLARVALPILRTGLSGIAVELNLSGRGLADWAKSAGTVRDVSSIFIRIKESLHALVPAGANVAAALLDVGTVGMGFLPKLADATNKLTTRFREFVAEARQSGQLSEWMSTGIATVKQLGQVALNVGSILNSVFTAGKTASGGLVANLQEATKAVADFLKSAQGQDILVTVFQTINGLVRALVPALQALGPVIAAVAHGLSDVLGAAVQGLVPIVQSLAPLFAELARVVGGALTAVVKALAPPLLAVTQAITLALLPVLPRLGDAFAQIVVAVTPVLFQLAAMTPVFGKVASAVTDVVVALAPFLNAMANTLVGALRLIIPALGAFADIIGGVARVLEPIAPILGTIVGGFVALKIAAAGIGLMQTALLGLGAAIAGAGATAGTLTTRLTGSAVAGERFANAGGKIEGAVSKVSAALPVVSLLLIGLTVLFDQLSDKAGELAKAVLDGSMTMQQAVADEVTQIERRNLAMDAATTAANEGIVSSQEGASAADVHAEAVANVRAELEKQAAVMPPLQAAQAQLRIAQDDYNQAVKDYTANSPQAQAASAALAAANLHLKDITRDTADATKTLGDKIVETSQAGAAAASSEVGYKQSLLNLADASKRAAQATKEHGASSTEAAAANLQMEQASLSAAAAAQRLAEDNAKASGSTNVAEIGAQAYKEELLRQAATMTGPLKQALIDQANGLDTAKRATSTAEIQSRLYKDQLGTLAAQTTGPLAAALAGAKQNFDTLGGAHATAEQKAAAQKTELQRLASMASGPVKASLLAMAAQINATPDGSFTITGTGVINPLQISSGTGRGASTFGLAEGGVIGQMADGGVMPGYTPGRDVHRFVSATGGILDLAGGEPVMRPEFGRAVGHQWIHAANKAARTGGVAGVASFIGRTAPRPAGVEGQRGDGSAFARGGVVPHQRLAFGGYVGTGTQPFPRVATESYVAARNKLVAMEAERIKAQIKKWLEAGGNGLAFARTQVGKPYVWGAVGPSSYDCSGFMSAITNVIRGRYPYSRVGSTGTFPWAGFSPGLGAGLNIGAFRGNPGHMAGTIAGVNVESAGSVGVRVGGPVGATSGMFNIRAHLADKGGLLPSGHAAVNLSGRDEYVVAPAAAQQMGSTYNVSVIFQNAINAMDDSLMRQAAIKVADEIRKVERSRT